MPSGLPIHFWTIDLSHTTLWLLLICASRHTELPRLDRLGENPMQVHGFSAGPWLWDTRSLPPRGGDSSGVQLTATTVVSSCLHALAQATQQMRRIWALLMPIPTRHESLKVTVGCSHEVKSPHN